MPVIGATALERTRAPLKPANVHLIDDRFARTEVLRLLPNWWTIETELGYASDTHERHNEKAEMHTFMHTFDLSPSTTADGLIEEVEITPTKRGYRLVKLSPCSDGRSLDASIVLGETYTGLSAIEWNLVRARKGSTLDLMDMVDISLPALDRWNEVIDRGIDNLGASGAIRSLSDVANVPDEQLEVLPNGELRIFVMSLRTTIEMRIAPTEWHWKE